MAAKKRMKKGSMVAQEKAKRQKIILAVLGVAFLGLLVFQGPKTLKMINKKAPANEAHASDHPAGAATAPAAAPAATPVAPATVAPSAAPTTVVPTLTPNNTVVVSGGIGIADTTVEPTPEAGQLISFDRFRTKDPFVPQVGAACTPDSTSGTTCPTVDTTPAPAAPAVDTTTTKTSPSTSTSKPAPTTSPTPDNTKPTTITPTTTPPAPETTAPPAVVPAKPTSATISLNGTEQTVAVKGSFPESDPTFTLVALTTKAAKIGLVGGSYSGGDPTITLKVGKTVTLMNTADGTRYKLKLVSVT